MDMLIKEVDQLASKFTLNKAVQTVVLSQSTSDILDSYSAVIDLFDTFTLVYKYIDSVYLYCQGTGMVYSNIEESAEIKSFIDNDWFRMFEEKGGLETQLLSRKKGGFYPFYISVTKPILLDPTYKAGALVINLDVEELGKIINSKDAPRAQSIYIIGNDGNIIYNEDRDMICTDANDYEYLNQVLSQPSGNVDILTVNNEKHVVSVLESEYFDWKYVSVISQTYYEEKFNEMKMFILNMILLCGVAAIVISLLISMKSFKPVRNILSVFDGFGITHDSVEENDEIKFITRNLVKTREEKYQMRDELEQHLALLNKAQAAALQAQINPHFMCNTLETINWMALELTDSENKVSYMVSKLAQLFRLNMDMENHMITIAEEIHYVNIYMSLIEVRYRNKFMLTWNIDEEILECMIVKLCLQPILENAVYHGIKPKHAMGVINVSGKVCGEDVLIRILDDGVGMEIDDVLKLNAEMQDAYSMTGEHIGIKNVNQRIKLIFGAQYGITVESTKGVETTVNIRIPKVGKDT